MSAAASESDLASLPLTCLTGVGPVRAERLRGMGFFQLRDLLVCVPQGLHRQGELVSAKEACARIGEELSVKGQLGSARIHRIGRRRSLTSVDLSDASGKVRALFFNQRWMKKQLEELKSAGGEVEIYGKLIASKNGAALSAARLGTAAKPLPKPGCISPIYNLAQGIGQGFLQALIQSAIEKYAALLGEPLSQAELRELELPALPQAVVDLNNPSSELAFQGARRRLSLEKLLAMQASLLLARLEHQGGKARASEWNLRARERLFQELPHVPTEGQQRVMNEIIDDLGKQKPMGRLLQGDVGAGKTMVAQAAMAAALQSGGQVCLLAPTELLAEQHARALEPWFSARGLACDLLIGSLPAARRRATGKRLSSGEAQVVIGTHALFSEGLGFKRLDLVVIDEQQRFGVEQKASLLDKGQDVHVLLMTATPIPRTLALSIYGDLDVSLLREKPPGRGQLKTHVVQPAKRPKMIAFLAKRLAQGEQVFWVRPRIDSEGQDDQEPEAQTAQPPPSLAALWHELKDGPLGAFGIEVVHGRMPSDERERRLERFRQGSAKLLLGTTIVEVGVDVPGATIMVVEGAERFGLSQLHQLRGRVGRGAGDAWCFLLGASSAKERLGVLEKTNDGFLIAEQDLLQRGMGDLAGVRQAGGNVEGLEDPVSDLELVLFARRLVESRADLLREYASQYRGRVV